MCARALSSENFQLNNWLKLSMQDAIVSTSLILHFTSYARTHTDRPNKLLFHRAESISFWTHVRYLFNSLYMKRSDIYNRHKSSARARLYARTHYSRECVSVCVAWMVSSEYLSSRTSEQKSARLARVLSIALCCRDLYNTQLYTQYTQWMCNFFGSSATSEWNP